MLVNLATLAVFTLKFRQSPLRGTGCVPGMDHVHNPVGGVALIHESDYLPPAKDRTSIKKHIDLSVTRREALSPLTMLIIQDIFTCGGGVGAGTAKTDSVRQGFSRFFQFVGLDSAVAAHAVV